MQQKFWNDTGPISDDGETSGILLPTPKSTEWKGAHGPGKNGHSGEYLTGAVRTKSISSVAASPASLFQWREVAKGTVMSATSGLCSESAFASFAPDGCLLKMFQGLFQLMLDGSSEAFSGILPSSGMMRSGRLYQQPPLVRRISANESSLFPTPTRNANRDCPSERRRESPSLESVVNLLPTPTSRDRKSGKASQDTMEKNARPLSETIGGLLSPRFVSLIMGLPADWCETEPACCDA